MRVVPHYLPSLYGIFENLVLETQVNRNIKVRLLISKTIKTRLRSSTQCISTDNIIFIIFVGKYVERRRLSRKTLPWFFFAS